MDSLRSPERQPPGAFPTSSQQALPPIASLTGELPHGQSQGPSQLDYSQNQNPNRHSDVRDSGNWSQSKHSSGVSNIGSNGLHLHTILNAEDSPSRSSIPDTPHSTRYSGHQVSDPTPRHTSSTLTLQSAGLPSLNQGFENHPRPSLDTPSHHESRRSSVDSRMNVGMNHLQITSPSSPYESANPSRVSLVSNLQQQRGIATDQRSISSAPMSPLGVRNGSYRSSVAPRRAPVINPNPRMVSGMPDPTAAAPTKGFPWAFPDHPDDRRRSSSGDSSMDRSVPSRQNSYAASINSSILTTESYPQGQKRLDEDLSTHHHSMQHRNVTALQSDGTSLASSGNYSRTPELRVSHKMAERKRRSEMKNLFEDLNTILPNSPGGKSSKWEILTKSIDYIKNLKSAEYNSRREADRCRNEIEYLRRCKEENEAMRQEMSVLYTHLRRVDPNNVHIYGPLTNQLAMETQSHAQPPPPHVQQQQQQGGNVGVLPPPAQWAGQAAAGGSNAMQGVEFGQSAYDRR
ncbi:hypothetical protein K402DRAFT_412834 [Aulographum hederae CBS 113979]|uniref:BHLH domain-containing protein n=1 Tax=Aulographum hederae CBS 113979 TaxID=1176131 RepID=A0A6G1GZC1_9PEZI|nr:hypothetical protein K402DRAFT_412834 [Aulographum hederae CBS 113979]